MKTLIVVLLNVMLSTCVVIVAATLGLWLKEAIDDAYPMFKLRRRIYSVRAAQNTAEMESKLRRLFSTEIKELTRANLG